MSGTLAIINPETGAVGGLSLWTLGGLFAFMFLWTFDKVFRALFASWMNKLAGLRLNAGFVHWAPFGFLGTAVTNVENWTRSGMAASERSITWGLHAMWWVIQDTGHTIAQLSSDTYHGLASVNSAAADAGAWAKAKVSKATLATMHAIAFAAVAAARAWWNTHFHRLDSRVTKLEHHAGVRQHPGAGQGVVERTPPIPAPTVKPHPVTHGGGIAVPLPVPALGNRVGITSKQMRRLARRIGKLEKATIGLGAVALVATALGRMGLGWLRCPSLGRLGKRFGCGGFALWEALLALSFDAWLVTDLCLIVNAMTKAARLFAGEIDYLAGQISGLIACQRATRPKALPVAWHEPPPVVNSLTL